MDSKKVNKWPETTEIDLPVSNALPLRNSDSDISIENQPDGSPCYIHAATSENTRRSYQADIRHFSHWGARLPTTGDVVLRYLQHYATTLNPRTLSRRLTAIKNWHLYQGFADPTAHPAIRKTLAGIRNVHGTPKKKATPLTLEAILQMSSFLKGAGRLIDCRNRALLLMGFFGAFRRSELAGITWEAITRVPEGMEILIPRSKTDQGGEGQVCAIPCSDDAMLCPVTALIEWREQSGNNTGHVFRQITAGGRVCHDAIKPQQVNAVMKLIAFGSGLPNAESYSSHSARRGFATEASRKGAPFGSIMRHGRWRHEGTVLGYIDEGRRFDQNAAGIIFNHHKNKSEDNKNEPNKENEKKPAVTDSQQE